MKNDYNDINIYLILVIRTNSNDVTSSSKYSQGVVKNIKNQVIKIANSVNMCLYFSILYSNVSIINIFNNITI